MSPDDVLSLWFSERVKPLWFNSTPEFDAELRERFDDTYNWTVKWNMTVPGATYETVVDNRAWE